MNQYLDILAKVRSEGFVSSNRTDTEAQTLFGLNAEYDLTEGFPLMRSKRVNFDAIVHELVWFLSGITNIQYLKDHGIKIWDAWADNEGNLGSVYGKQWRAWEAGDSGKPIDQISNLIQGLKDDPTSRRHILSAWNVSDLPNMALAPCHILFQCHVNVETNQLSGQLYQRSADLFLGVPFNVACYSLLIHILAHLTGYSVGKFYHNIGNAHIYVNHFAQVDEQLSRRDEANSLPMPTITLDQSLSDIDDFSRDSVVLNNYHPLGVLRGKVAV